MADAAQTTAADATIVQQATTGTTTPTEFTYTFPDNRVYKAATEKELLDQVGNRYKELFGHAETLKEENAQFRQSVAQLATGQQPTTQGFSQEKYLEIWTRNPVEAQQYVNQHDPQYTSAVSKLEQIEWQNQTGAFLAANKDFPMSETNTATLSKVCDQMFPGHGVISAAQMKAAHLYCNSEKMYGEPTMTTTATPPPPPPQGSSSTTANGAPDIGKMNQQELRQYIESLEQQQK